MLLVVTLLLVLIPSQVVALDTIWDMWWPQVQSGDHMKFKYDERYMAVPPPEMLKAAFIGRVDSVTVIECTGPHDVPLASKVSFTVLEPIVGDVTDTITLTSYGVVENSTGDVQHVKATILAPWFRYLLPGEIVLVAGIPDFHGLVPEYDEEVPACAEGLHAGYIRYLQSPLSDRRQVPLRPVHCCKAPAVSWTATGISIDRYLTPDSLNLEQIIELIREVFAGSDGLELSE